MKKIVFLLVMASVLVVSCNTKTASDVSVGTSTTMEFSELVHDFGTIEEGTIVKFSFKFINNGDEDLVISNVSPSCGCTVANFPTEPIRKGDGGSIGITFDSSNRIGSQNKTISVLANSDPTLTTLVIKAKVVDNL